MTIKIPAKGIRLRWACENQHYSTIVNIFKSKVNKKAPRGAHC